MSARSHGGSGGLLGTLRALCRSRGPFWEPGGGCGDGDPPCMAGRAQRWCSALCRELMGSGHPGVPPGLGVPQLGAGPCPWEDQGLLAERGPPRCHFKGSLQLSPLQWGSLCPPPPRCRGFRGSLLAGLWPGLDTEHAGCPAAPRQGKRPRGACSPPHPRPLPSLSPPGTLKVLKVKYYRLLCCCLTTTDKLRTSCQNVSAQQINIQNESQRYVVYN